jgi:hypothetical protein
VAKYVPFLCLGCCFHLVVLNEHIRVAAALFGFDGDILQFAKGFEYAPEISLEFLLAELTRATGTLESMLVTKSLVLAGMLSSLLR